MIPSIKVKGQLLRRHVVYPLQLNSLVDGEKPSYFSILGQNGKIQMVMGGEAGSQVDIDCLQLVFIPLTVNGVIAFSLASDSQSCNEHELK